MKLIAFALYDSTGVPLTTAVPGFAVYSGKDNVSRTPPTIINRGGGVYAFDISAVDDAFGVAFLISSGAGANPAYLAGSNGGELQAFALYNSGASPLAGASPTFATYINASGAALTPPAIVDFTSGLYAFVVALADFAIGIAFEISSGAGALPTRFNGFAQDDTRAITPSIPPYIVPTVQLSPNADAYARQLRQLLPPGRLWNLEPDSATFKVLQALADSFARVGDRCDALMLETLPGTALETLGDWERVLGLPDSCSAEVPTSITERQTAAQLKYVSQGGQSPAYFIALALAMGYTASISLYQVCRSGSAHCGDLIYNEAWAYAWLVTISGQPPESVSIARSGTAHSGDRLQGFAELDIECVIKRAAPAHTIPLFTYTL